MSFSLSKDRMKWQRASQDASRPTLEPHNSIANLVSPCLKKHRYYYERMQKFPMRSSRGLGSPTNCELVLSHLTPLAAHCSGGRKHNGSMFCQELWASTYFEKNLWQTDNLREGKPYRGAKSIDFSKKSRENCFSQMNADYQRESEIVSKLLQNNSNNPKSDKPLKLIIDFLDKDVVHLDSSEEHYCHQVSKWPSIPSVSNEDSLHKQNPDLDATSENGLTTASQSPKSHLPSLYSKFSIEFPSSKSDILENSRRGDIMTMIRNARTFSEKLDDETASGELLQKCSNTSIEEELNNRENGFQNIETSDMKRKPYLLKSSSLISNLQNPSQHLTNAKINPHNLLDLTDVTSPHQKTQAAKKRRSTCQDVWIQPCLRKNKENCLPTKYQKINIGNTNNCNLEGRSKRSVIRI